ncbi:hypothetical protein PEBR_29493 [Penicillium brasilianum]|uniref:Uncharacterized protein n=1 Tax=Penicillium brasilianum TaxID=104259 RepID=A0A1S9RGK3_PENBI|nr:hypothetical protein PEBR_29493 [Penicillium brasilianum]
MVMYPVDDDDSYAIKPPSPRPAGFTGPRLSGKPLYYYPGRNLNSSECRAEDPTQVSRHGHVTTSSADAMDSRSADIVRILHHFSISVTLPSQHSIIQELVKWPSVGHRSSDSHGGVSGQ